MDSSQLFGCNEGGEVTLRVSSDPTPISAEVVSITDSGRGDGTAVYVFECDTLTASVASGRTAQFKYIVNSYGGLRISKSALRYTDDDVEFSSCRAASLCSERSTLSTGARIT